METRRHQGIHGDRWDTWGLLLYIYIYIYMYYVMYIIQYYTHTHIYIYIYTYIYMQLYTFFMSRQHGGSFHFTFESSGNDVSQSKVPVSVGSYISVRRAGTK